jgi:hypothetical protein
MNLVDSSGWLAYFADEPAADFFAEAIEDSDLLLVPSVCIYEVFKVVLRERGEDDAFSAVAAMQQGTAIDLDGRPCHGGRIGGFERGLGVCRFGDLHGCEEAQCYALDTGPAFQR